MSSEQDPSAESLYKEHGKAVRSLDVWHKEDQQAAKDLGEALAVRKEVLTDTSGSEELDRRNADFDVQKQVDLAAEARAHVKASQKRYDSNIKDGAANADNFVEEAKAEDVSRSAEIQS